MISLQVNGLYCDWLFPGRVGSPQEVPISLAARLSQEFEFEFEFEALLAVFCTGGGMYNDQQVNILFLSNGSFSFKLLGEG